MRLRKKKSLLDQASDYVDAVRPQVEAAVAQAIDAVEEFVHDTARPALADAREKAGPALAEARVRAATAATDAREKAAPVVADARAKAVPLIAAGATIAGEKANAVKELADAKVAELKGDPPKKKGGKLKKVALIAVVAGAAGFAAKKLQGSKQSDSWQSSYVPAPPPAGPTSPKAPGAPTVTADDIGGAAPDEAIADQVEDPHPVTTPEDPAEVVPIDEGKK
ncbi:hypothetical protein [Nocardioides sp. W7]|uniref:hypothetical protein n=1 Tax=Nocardioides sp. W7 TaxID=2931390 RepID=UPI001FD4E696|nr:hypothetical protein [Nocardioides sp. W7]